MKQIREKCYKCGGVVRPRRVRKTPLTKPVNWWLECDECREQTLRWPSLKEAHNRWIRQSMQYADENRKPTYTTADGTTVMDGLPSAMWKSTKPPAGGGIEFMKAPMCRPTEGAKFDDGKARFDLIPPSLLEAVASVLTYGAKKYAPDNWRLVEDFQARYTAALMRHLEAWRAGEKLDKESGLPHLAHVACNVAFLIEGPKGVKP